MRDVLRTGAFDDGDKIVEWNHLAAVGADVVLANVLRGETEGSISLYVDAVGAVVELEVVDVLRTHVDAEGVVDLRERNADGLGFVAIDGDDQLRVVGGEAGVEAGDASVRITASADDLVSDAIEIGEGVATFILQLELEAAEAADTLNGWRRESDDKASGDAEELGLDTGDDVCIGMTLLEPRVFRIERSEDDALVGGCAIEAEAHDGEGAEDVGVFGENDLCLIGEMRGVAERRTLRSEYLHDQVALIFCRNEARGNVLVHVCGSA